VGLLASLVVWSPLRWIFDRLLPDTAAGQSGLGELIGGLNDAPRTVFARGLGGGAALVLVLGGIVAAGAPAREKAVAATVPIAEIQLEVDTATLPEVFVDDSMHRLDVRVNDDFVGRLAVTLAENLAIEEEAVRTADGGLLGSSDGGERLDEMQARLDAAIATGDRWADDYRFESLSLRIHEAAEGQASAGLVFDGEGMVDRVLYDPTGVEQDRVSERFDLSFVLRQLAGDRWLIVDVVPRA
jgi:hypothetical protein